MATTITISTGTKQRLDDYKMGNMTYDDLLNSFMDSISIEDIAEDHIKEHYRRMKDLKPIEKDEFKKRILSSS
ncbi:MAG: hypothetical protein ACMUIG_02665 [Thermoplasmatota archaeon]